MLPTVFPGKLPVSAESVATQNVNADVMQALFWMHCVIRAMIVPLGSEEKTWWSILTIRLFRGAPW